ncbi:flagellar motor switch protein FliN [Novosphingobium sp. CF614]|uniref:FliM/FliN family flagellar motor switch protein n=1 Tax=Novosphingobium sp. CF614 TaxID=1884364 RepID=UPI0008E04277|nr:FliM/FliN family flagellar motor switch protein [Novosphingobium sp. CF614]SFG54088.1 flagellar motor switch protein FliN [Novosphingobium sp. CF614]
MTASKESRNLGNGNARPQVVPLNQELLGHVRVRLSARLGQGEVTVARLMSLAKGDVVVLEASLADAVDLYVADALVARGEIVAVGDNYGVRITEIASVE